MRLTPKCTYFGNENAQMGKIDGSKLVWKLVRKQVRKEIRKEVRKEIHLVRKQVRNPPIPHSLKQKNRSPHPTHNPISGSERRCADLFLLNDFYFKILVETESPVLVPTQNFVSHHLLIFRVMTVSM